MGASYILMITAFYVDNGRNLPLWRELPQIAFWVLPALVGTPVILAALDREPRKRPTAEEFGEMFSSATCAVPPASPAASAESAR